MRTTPKEVIFQELNRTYLRENNSAGVSWYCQGNGGTELNRELTLRILDYLVSWFIDPEDRQLDQDIANIIWHTWPGGGTALNVSRRIIKQLHLED